MFNLFVVNEIYTSGYSIEILNIISLIAILCGILVIISKNPIVSVLFLIGLFLSIASFLSMLSLNFLGLSYLLVYVGAVSILFLFILMLINVRISELFSNTNNTMPLAIIISILFYFTIRQILPNIIHTSNIAFTNILHIDYNTYFSEIFKWSNIILDNKALYYVTSSSWDSNLSEISHITSIGNIMYTSYSIWLILTSLILLLAMVGAIVITINKKN